MVSEEEVLRYIDSARAEIQDVTVNMLNADDGLSAVKELIRTGGGAGIAHTCAAGYIERAQGACTNMSLTADKLLRWLAACDKRKDGEE